MLILRRLIAFLTAPVIASVLAAFAQLAVFGQVPSSFSDFLVVLLFVSRFGLAAAIVIGVPATLVLWRLRRFSFWSVLALGATLGLVVALAVHFSVVPRTIGWSLAYCVLPGAVGAACFWWIGGWSASPSLQRTVGPAAGFGSPGAMRWRRGFLAALAAVALGLAAALLIPRPDLSGVSSAELQRRARLRPRTPADLFSAAQWEAAKRREPHPGLENMEQMFELRLRNGAGVIPLDEKLLTRVTFVGRSVREIRELLGPSQFETDQPFGMLSYGMWPMVRDCAQPVLVFSFEPDRDLERRIVSEVIERRIVSCVT